MEKDEDEKGWGHRSVDLAEEGVPLLDVCPELALEVVEVVPVALLQGIELCRCPLKLRCLRLGIFKPLIEFSSPFPCPWEGGSQGEASPASSPATPPPPPAENFTLGGMETRKHPASSILCLRFAPRLFLVLAVLPLLLPPSPSHPCLSPFPSPPVRISNALSCRFLPPPYTTFSFYLAHCSLLPGSPHQNRRP